MENVARRNATPRDHAIRTHKLQKRNLHVADRHPEARRLVRANVPEAELAQAVPERLNSRAPQHLHERDVQRHHQSVAHRHHAAVPAVEVRRPVPLVRHRNVAQPLVRRDDAPLDRKRREERLERRARRTRRDRGVDLPVRLVEVVAAASERLHVAASRLHHHRSDRVAARARSRVHRVLACRLDVCVERRSYILSSSATSVAW